MTPRELRTLENDLRRLQDIQNRVYEMIGICVTDETSIRGQAKRSQADITHAYHCTLAHVPLIKASDAIGNARDALDVALRALKGEGEKTS